MSDEDEQTIADDIKKIEDILSSLHTSVENMKKRLGISSPDSNDAEIPGKNTNPFTIPWPIPDNPPHISQDPSCSLCGGLLKNMTHYVCGNTNCPVFPRITYLTSTQVSFEGENND